MDLLPRNFPNIGVVEGQLPEDVVANLWTVINEAREKPEDMKPELAGNISSSIRLDSGSPLLENFIKDIVPKFMDSHIESYGPPWRAVMKEGEGFNLESLWVNFQKKHEFNPPHDHGGVYSFVIWMQIPTSYAEQRKLPVCAESNADNHISNFAFSYTNTLGKVSTFAYNMEKEAEGYMVMFPAQMLHQVFPFYENDGERISISGNVNIEKRKVKMAREADQIAQDYSAMLGSVSVITEVIKTHDKGASATHEDFCGDMTTAEKKERVARSKGYLDHMKALEDWGSEDMAPVTSAINAATTFIG